MGPGLPINSSAAGGPALDGYLPGYLEASMADARKFGSTNLMEYADTYNPRTRALATLGARGMSGATTSASLNEWLNYTRAGFFMKQGARASQNMMGSGSFSDMAYASQQVIGGGGIRVGRQFGGPQYVGGGGMQTDIMAQRMFNRMSNYYYDDRGLAMQSRTLGRDPTEISRAMQIVAASGQMAGKELFSFGKLSVVDRLRNAAADMRGSNHGDEARKIQGAIRQIQSGNLGGEAAMDVVKNLSSTARKGGQDALSKLLDASVINMDTGYKMNAGAMDAFHEQVKTLSKLQDMMKDIFGEISDMESVSMSSQITGISANSVNSFARMKSAMEKIKYDAAAVGVGASQYAQGVGAMGGMFGQTFGSQAFGGLYARTTAAGAYAGARGSQAAQNAGFGRAYSADQIQMENNQDVGDLMKESGAQAVVKLAYMAETDKSLTDDQRTRIRAATRAFKSASAGEGRAKADATLQNLLGEVGQSNRTLTEQMTFVESTASGAGVAEALAGAVNQSTRHNLRRDAAATRGKYGVGLANDGADALFDLGSTIGMEQSGKIAQLLATGATAAAYALINSDANAPYLAEAGLKPADIIAQLEKAGAATTGGMKGLGNGLQYLIQNGGAQMANLSSTKDTIDARNDAVSQRIADAKAGSGTPGKDGFGRAVASMLFSQGMAPESTLREVMAYAEASGGVKDTSRFKYNDSTRALELTDDQLKAWAGDAALMGEMGMDAGNVDALRKEVGTTNGTGKFMDALSKLDYNTGSTGDGLFVLSSAETKSAEDKMKKDVSDKYYEQLGIDVSPEERAWLAKGDPDGKISPGRRNEINAAQKTAVNTKFGITDKKYFSKAGQAGDFAQYVKDAIYSKDPAKAAMAFAAMSNLNEETKKNVRGRLAADSDFGNHLGADPEKWKDEDKNWEEIHNKLAETAGIKVNEAPKPMASMHVENLYVTKHH